MTNGTSSDGFLLHHVSWLTMVLAFLAVVTFFAISSPVQQYVVQTGVRMMNPSGAPVAVPEASGVPGVMKNSGASYLDQYPYYNPNIPVTDTREFLKVNYSAAMRTRDVQGLTRRVETTVRGYGGRIDQESSSPESGYVSFVVPMSKYDAFRTELEGLVGNRFLTVNISSQNLLPQKQSIEEQQKQADSTLAGYKTARQKLINTHASVVQSLQAQIDRSTVPADVLLLKQQLANENASYSLQLSSANANVKYAESWQKAVQTQDQALLDSVATVTGTVSIQWINYWEMAQLYLPGYWIPTIFAALALLSYLRDRRRFAAA